MELFDLKAADEAGIKSFMDGYGLPGYRAKQLIHWIYERGATEIDQITVFSRDLRAKLAEKAYISNLDLIERLKSRDGSEKYLFGLEDGLAIESVLIPDEDRLTLCVSSQVGCAMGCKFCRTGRMGFVRDLRAHEIVDQVIAAGRLISPQKINNIVFMGMGEPLMNVRNVAEAIARMNALLSLSRRKITVSTSGVVPGIEELPMLLGARGITFNLAISLNATTDETRSQLMPINRKYPIAELMQAVRRFPLQKTRKITFEYVMVGGVNDSIEDARRLAKLVRGIPNKVNLIPLNPFEGCGLSAPAEGAVVKFQAELDRLGVTALIRKSKGGDIMASCGQLYHAELRRAGRA